MCIRDRYANSMCDFWIYAGMSKKFRTSCFNIFRKFLVYCKRNDSKVNPQMKDSNSAAAICNVNSEDNQQQVEHDLNFTPTLSARRRSVMDPIRAFYKTDSSSNIILDQQKSLKKKNNFNNLSSP